MTVEEAAEQLGIGEPVEVGKDPGSQGASVEPSVLPPSRAAMRLVILPDPDARVDLGAPLLGKPIAARLVEAALDAGFVGAWIAPGAARDYPGAREVPVDEPFEQGPAAALIVFEGTYVDPRLIELMVEHPLDADERFTLYDGALRPAACFVGRLAAVPPLMPIAEELDWPEGHHPGDVARVVYPEDRARAEWLVLRQEGVLPSLRRDRDSPLAASPSTPLTETPASSWDREVKLRSLRWLAARRASIAQLELVALLVAVAAGPVALVVHPATMLLAGTMLLLGVHASSLLRSLRRLRGPRVEATAGSEREWIPGETLADATRPLAHAVLTAALTYDLVAETARSGVAGLTLLILGCAATALSLAHARALLRGTGIERLALPRGEVLLRRIGVRLPSALDGAPLLELAVALACVTAMPAIPWTILLVASGSRLWGWFTAPAAPGDTSPHDAPGDGPRDPRPRSTATALFDSEWIDAVGRGSTSRRNH